jgi:hypothetical protein
MKIKSLLIFKFLFFFIISNAQYKKASIFNKIYRTYEIGTTMRNMGKGNIPTLGYFFSHGIEKDKKAFHWFMLEFVPRTKFKYETISSLNNIKTAVTVTGRVSSTFSYRYCLGYKLSNINKKFIVFTNLNVGFIFAFADGIDIKTTPLVNNFYSILDKKPMDAFSVFTVGAGLGLKYKLNNKFSIFSTNTYNIIKSITRSNGLITLYGAENLQITMRNHPSFNIGLKISIDKAFE